MHRTPYSLALLPNEADNPLGSVSKNMALTSSHSLGSPDGVRHTATVAVLSSYDTPCAGSSLALGSGGNALSRLSRLICGCIPSDRWDPVALRSPPLPLATPYPLSALSGFPPP